MVWRPMKTKPNKPNLKWNEGLFVYYARDCHGPSGLAMTPGSLLFRAPSTESTLSGVEWAQGMLSGFVAKS